MRDELVTARLATIDQVDGMLAADGTLTEADITRLMLTVNSLRLVLGTLLDVTEDEARAGLAILDEVYSEMDKYYVG